LDPLLGTAWAGGLPRKLTGIPTTTTIIDAGR
jgi:hypothetical protein